MPEVPSLVGVTFGFIAILTAIFALRDQRKQTRLMEAQLDKRIEVKITRDLEAADLAPEGAPRSAIDSQLRTYLNTRLSRVRADMRDEFNRRLNEIAHKDGDLAMNAVNVMSAHDNAIAKFEESNNRMGALEQQVQALQRAYDDIRSGADANTWDSRATASDDGPGVWGVVCYGVERHAGTRDSAGVRKASPRAMMRGSTLPCHAQR